MRRHEGEPVRGQHTIGYEVPEMRQHILIERGTRRHFDECPEMPPGARFDRTAGFWKLGNEPLVRSEEFRDKPVTKKCDQETGEDQKGE